MRTFIAISLPQEAKDFLSNIQLQLRSSRADVKWVEVQNIHLTLKFLGERDAKQIDKIKIILDEIAQNNKSYAFYLCSIGAFPKKENPSIIWIGVSEGNKETEKIATEIEDKIARIGIPKEKRPFSCHITLGRAKTPKGKEKLIEQISLAEKNLPTPIPRIQVDKITLFKSTLTSKGPIYEILHEANLKNS